VFGKHYNRFTPDEWQDARQFIALRLVEIEAERKAAEDADQ
jgi:hypothetical protein